MFFLLFCTVYQYCTLNSSMGIGQLEISVAANLKSSLGYEWDSPKQEKGKDSIITSTMFMRNRSCIT